MMQKIVLQVSQKYLVMSTYVLMEGLALTQKVSISPVSLAAHLPLAAAFLSRMTTSRLAQNLHPVVRMSTVYFQPG